MAVLLRENGERVSDLNAMVKFFEPLGLRLEHWPLLTSKAKELAGAETLSPEQAEVLLDECDPYFHSLKVLEARDLVALSSSTTGLDEMLAKFSSVHTHDDDEVRYIVDGEGVFGFVMPESDEQVLLKVESEDFIWVPKGTRHWFVLTPSKRIKAVRYFTSKEGWVPNYLELPVRVNFCD